jgi:hypothetical protein
MGRSPGSYSGSVEFEWFLERWDPVQTVLDPVFDFGNADSGATGAAQIRVSNVPVKDYPVTWTFRVQAMSGTDRTTIDRTPAVATFVVKQRWLRPEKLGQEGDSHADPASDQPFKYFREEPE